MQAATREKPDAQAALSRLTHCRGCKHRGGRCAGLPVGKVARAAADGYTIGIGHWGTHVVNGAIYALAYDVLRDFEPVAMIATNPQLIVAKKSVPAQDLQGLIAWLKANSATA